MHAQNRQSPAAERLMLQPPHSGRFRQKRRKSDQNSPEERNIGCFV
jgi:hypothetical protein